MAQTPVRKVRLHSRLWQPNLLQFILLLKRSCCRVHKLRYYTGIVDKSENIWTAQESGIVDSAGTQFGPATREYYDTSQWAMTVANPSTVEFIPDPVPSQRRRNNGEPCFIKPLANGDYLPALITILHAIPLACRALLLPENALTNYGYDAGWWQGAPIRLEEIVNLDEDEMPDYGEEIIRETQRLMAFLECSERSYGSAEALSSMKGFEYGVSSLDHRAKTLYDKFLVRWEDAATRLVPEVWTQGSLFRFTASEKADDRIPREDRFWCLEIPLITSGVGRTQTLYDALDEMIWTIDPNGTSNEEQSISGVSPILVIRALQPDSTATGLNMQVPASWFVDRYLTENSLATKVMRRNLAKCHLELQSLDDKKRRLTTFVHTKTGKTMDVQTMLEVAKSAFEPAPKVELNDEEEGEEDVESSSRRSSNAFDLPELLPKPDVVAQLQSISDNIKRKLERLEQEKLKAQQQLEEYAALFKGPSEYQTQNPTHRYDLCGVAIDPRTTFVLHRAKQTLISMSEEPTPQNQWWKFNYTNDPIITKEKVTEDEVLNFASCSGREVMLVYASKEAVQDRDFSIPDSLKVSICNPLTRLGPTNMCRPLSKMTT